MKNMVGDGVQVLSGRDVPQQFHLGRECNPKWVRAQDMSLPSHALSVKPMGAMWTAPELGKTADGGVVTTWSETYFRRGYDKSLRDESSVFKRIRAALKPERQWEVVPDDDAQIVLLDSADALHA